MKTILFFIVLTFSTANWASLLISPTHIVFTDRDRVQEVTLVNTSNTTNTYRITMVDMKQDNMGKYSAVTSEGFEFSAQNILRYSPKQVSLKSGERQTIKIVARRSNTLEDGDYRSHLKFTALPNQSFAANQDGANNTGVNIRLDPVINYTIPVALQVGTPVLSFNVGSSRLITNADNGITRTELELTINKRGNNGIFGKIEIFLKEDKNKTSPLGLVNGANIFREADSRTFYIKIKDKASILDINSLRVRFSDTIHKKIYIDEPL